MLFVDRAVTRRGTSRAEAQHLVHAALGLRLGTVGGVGLRWAALRSKARPGQTSKRGTKARGFPGT